MFPPVVIALRHTFEDKVVDLIEEFSMDAAELEVTQQDVITLVAFSLLWKAGLMLASIEMDEDTFRDAALDIFKQACLKKLQVDTNQEKLLN